MSDVADLLLGGGFKGGANERPFDLLTESWDFDTMNRRAGGMLAPGGKHADAHRYCSLGRCGNRPGPYKGGYEEVRPTRFQKITAWRKAKAARNRQYLEEFVYAKK